MISRQYAWKHLSTDTLIYLPMPGRDIGKPKIRFGGEQSSAGGQLSFDTATRLHTFTLPFTYLTPTEYALLKTMRDTLGPHWYTDDSGVTLYPVLVDSLDATTPLLTYTAATLVLRQYQ